MDLQTILQGINPATAQAFVHAARQVIDALLIEGERIRQTQTPAPRDYETAGLPRDTPGGGWLGQEELRDAAQRTAEAVALEKWADGVLFAIKALVAIGGVL